MTRKTRATLSKEPPTPSPMKRYPWWLRFPLLQINGLFPFLYPARVVFERGNLLRAPLAYLRDYRRFKAMPPDPAFPLQLSRSYPALYDRYAESGDLPRHYFHQDLWAARRVRNSGVAIHHDFGSRLDGFIAHCLAFCEVVMFDIRPLSTPIEGLRFVEANITNLTGVADASIDSLSSLHALEHIGLGRYGDPIDPFGYRLAIDEIQRVLAPGARLYVSVPIGVQRLEFNGQRVFDPRYVLECFNLCELVEFAAVDDDNVLHDPAVIDDFRASTNACGLFHFRKRPNPTMRES